MKKNKKVTIGFIAFGESTYKYLPRFLKSLEMQTLSDFEILVYDNTPGKEDKNLELIKKDYPQIKIFRSGFNLGFSVANNVLIREAKKRGAKYYFAINPDTFLEEDALEFLVNRMDENPELGSVAPKILRWDFENDKKTEIIDSLGIKLRSGLRFADVRQGELDDDDLEYTSILGPSGAAALYRISALEKTKEGNNYFEELMFMYKEDCDLAYRLFLASYKSECVHDAIVYHDRSVSAGGERDVDVIANRKYKSKQVRAWSFLNQQIIFVKFRKLLSLREKMSVDFYLAKMIVFAFFKEPFLLRELLNLAIMRPKIKTYPLKK